MRSPPLPPPAPGSIITFYSYKGGTGRSMALANVACLLAQRQAQAAGRGVLMVDWDLEAPGLHRFFRDRFQRRLGTADDYAKALDHAPGLIDLFWKLDEIVAGLPAGHEEPGRDSEQRLRKALDLGPFVLETDIDSLHLLKAGRYGDDYPQRVNTFGWEALYNRAPWLIAWFARWLAEQYEYVLIDSRTGITDISGICTMLLPEKLAVVFTPNLQSIEGALEQIERATTYRRRSSDLRPLTVYPLPSRIEWDLQAQREYWRFDPSCGYQRRFEDLFQRVYGLDKCDMTDYFNNVQLLQIRDYAYGEQIAVLTERGAEKASLTSSYVEFTDRLLAPSEPWETPRPPEIGAAERESVRRAYAAIAGLSPTEEVVARGIFTRLVRVAQGPEDGPDTARRVNVRDLGETAVAIVEKLEATGVLRPVRLNDDHFVELDDAVLVGDWAPLKDWVEQDREFLQWRQRLDDTIAQWRSSGAGGDLLLRGTVLQRAQESARTRAQDLNREELAFIAESYQANYRDRGVFISYSHDDERWKNRLVAHLAVIEREGLLRIWDGGRIQPGIDWRAEIQAAMAEARVAVLLVSASFLTSDFILTEVGELLQRRQREGLTVIAVIVKPCAWQASPLASIQARPTGGKALSGLSSATADKELARIAREVLEQVLSGNVASGGVPSLRPHTGAARHANLHQLPHPPADFTGRSRELEALKRAATATGGAAPILGVYGRGGVGKTTLALKLAEAISQDYPDGQIYLDLQASTSPLSAAQASAYVVRSLMPEAQVPEQEADVAALYRPVLDGKRVLVFLDDAAGQEQVEPLLPPRGCALLVTSRLRFTLPGLFAVNLDGLTAEEACALLLRISPRIGSAADALARLCDGLPLALRLAGSVLAQRSGLAPSVYARQLAQDVERLGSVDAALTASCGLLPADVRLLWPLLAVFPGTFDAAAASAVWELGERAGEDALGELMASSLLDREEGLVRYRLHDLARSFADRQLDEADRAAARRRHAAHYLVVLRRAEALYHQRGEGVVRGLELFDADWPNIQAGQAWAAAQPVGDAEAQVLCDTYPDAAVDCLALRLPPGERILWREAALAAARRRRDRAAEAIHLGHLGDDYLDLGDSQRAIELYEESLAMIRELGDRHREGTVLGNLGLAYAGIGETQRAIDLYEQSLAIARQIGDRRRESAVLGNLGSAYADFGNPGLAAVVYEQQLVIAQAERDRWGEAKASWNLGLALASQGDLARAVRFMQVLVSLERETGHVAAERDAAEVDALRAKLAPEGSPTARASTWSA